MAIKNVFVVDATNRERRECITLAFEKEGVNTYCYDGDTTYMVQNDMLIRANTPECVDLVILHENNRNDWEDLEMEVVLPLIKYTGGTPPGYSEREGKAEIWIRRRSIKGSIDTPTKQEVKEILEWGNYILAGKEDPSIPSLFVVPGAINYLPALAILCQGYLAAHASNGEDHNEVLKPALKQMGWFDLGDDREKIYKALRHAKGKVTLPEWWLAPFGLDRKRMDDSEWEKFENKFQDEKTNVGEEGWDTVKRFINENIRNGDFKPETIANVYCSLVSILEGRPCST